MVVLAHTSNSSAQEEEEEEAGESEVQRLHEILSQKKKKNQLQELNRL